MSHPPSLAVRVGRVEAALRRALQPLLDEHGLTLEHWRILAVVADAPGLGMGEVATAAAVPAATLTRHADRLVERGLLVRRVDPADRRRAVVALSPLGQAYAGRLLAAERTAAVPDYSVATIPLRSSLTS
ncbi:MarR family winged helix-turn-helix transcriptional regulator [Nocardioides humi]|uniref:HTH marR-type domain-containing protein n=1 Tax=Nocardioides humi TaxID=449461 RepID=A0ABN2B9I2_9ACTN|nr:MarR family transcriptional regulator [Nocardioides humi]